MDAEPLEVDPEPLEVDAEVDADDGLVADDVPPPAAAAADDELEDGELDDSDSEEAAPAGRGAFAPEPLTEEARRRRAERFGGDVVPVPEPMLEPVGPSPAERTKRRALYASLGLSEPVDGPVQWRPEAVHVRGTGTMTTGDVMDYFFRFRPAHVEWVGEGACNVVWMDDVGPVRALLELSSPIAPSGADKAAAAPAAPAEEEEDPDALLVGLDTMDSDAPLAPAQDAHMKEAGEEEAVDAADIKTQVPPGRWRLGVPHRLTENLFLRFATRGDRRLPGAEQSRSGHVKLYGDPSHPSGVAGIITERRRRELRGQPADEPPPPPGKVNPWGGIAASWATAEAVRRPVRDYDHDPELNLLRDGGRPPDLRRRLESRVNTTATATATETETDQPLPRKRQRSGSSQEGAAAADSDEEEWRTRLKVPRMRMHADDELEKPVTARRPARGDLRARLGGGGRWRKNAELSADERTAAGDRRQRYESSPLRLDYEQDDDDLTAPAEEFDPEKPVNIKITRDFSGDELSGGESSEESGSESGSGSGSGSESGSGSDSESESESEPERKERDEEQEEAELDRRTDRNSAADLRARLNRKRALAKSDRPPLKIEVDNDVYYRVIGSDSD